MMYQRIMLPCSWSVAGSIQIEADRRNRIWEKQAAAYVDGIKGIRHQQKIRASQVVNIITGSPALTDPAPVDWSDVEARLLTYASPAIIDKLRASSDAGIKFVTTWRHLDHMPPRTERLKMVEQARQEAKDADGLDDELMDTIRDKLHAGTDRAPEPPVPLAGSAQHARSACCQPGSATAGVAVDTGQPGPVMARFLAGGRSPASTVGMSAGAASSSAPVRQVSSLRFANLASRAGAW
jgi:hypothetical protein